MEEGWEQTVALGKIANSPRSCVTESPRGEAFERATWATLPGLAEWEVMATLLVLANTSGMVSVGELTVPRARWMFPDLNESHVAIAFGVLAALLWAGPAGTHVVRGVLDKARTLPPHGDRDGRDRAQSLSDAEARSGDSTQGESAIVTASGQPLDPRGIPPWADHRDHRAVGTGARGGGRTLRSFGFSRGGQAAHPRE